MSTRPHPALLLVMGLALASAGLEVAWTTGLPLPWLATDVVLLWVVAVLGTAATLVPALCLGRWWPARRTGVALGSLVLLHTAVAIRFGPFLNTSAASPLLLGSWLALGLACLGLGWWISPRLDRLPRGILRGAAALGPLGLGVGLVRALHPLPDADASGPDVLLVTLDTVRRDRISVYGPTRVETPALEDLAEGGTTFQTAVAPASQTGPAHLSLLTGVDPLTHGVVSNGTRIGPQPAALPRVLRARGWHTAAVVGGFPVHAHYGFDQGFDVFDSDFSPLMALHELSAVRAVDALVWRNIPRERTGDRVNARVRRWLRREPPGPWLLWVHYYDPHGPYTPPAPFHERYVDHPPVRDGPSLDLPAYWPRQLRTITDPDYFVAQYDAEVAWTDHLLGELLDLVQPAVGDQGLLVAVTADHGESLTEHGILFDHGDDLYDPALLVPMVLAGPGVPAGVVVHCQRPTVDLVPTLLDLLDVDDGLERDGRSALPSMAGTSCEHVDAFSSTVAARRPDPPVDYALRRPEAKYVAHREGEDACYDLGTDPGETRNMVVEHPASPTVESLRRDLGRRLEDARAPRSSEAGSRAVLEALGYLEPEE